MISDESRSGFPSLEINESEPLGGWGLATDAQRLVAVAGDALHPSTFCRRRANSGLLSGTDWIRVWVVERTV